MTVLTLMAYLYCRIQTQVLTRICIQNLMATLHYAEHVHFAQSRIQIPIQTWIPNNYCTHFLGWISVSVLGS